MVKPYDFISELTSSSVSGSEVSSLAHEVGDDPVEGRSLEPVALLSSAQGTEVLSGLGDNIRTQLHDNLAEGSSISGNIEENPHG